MKPTLCLNMIVKNEAKIIERCLASVRPLISTWVIVDTGSTDGTQEVIRSFFSDLPGNLFERPWRSFGENRTEALELARGKADYFLVMDADDEMVIPEGWELPSLDQDAYHLLLSRSGHSMYRAQILRSALPWRYEGVLHEFPTCGVKVRQGKLPGLTVRMHVDGARAADPQKFQKDARVLEEALLREPGNTRYAFYLAQSYRDAGMHEEAIAAYLRRAAMGGFAEEVWYSLLQVAQVGERAGRPADEVIAAYLAAFENRPSRAESVCNLARYCRLQGKPAMAYLFARAAAEIPLPKDTLFLDDMVYVCRARDELMMAAHLTGRGEEAGRLARALLESGKLPAGERGRVEQIRARYGRTGPARGSSGMASCK
jgi:tetratricopeptide (TPR) repeat protein